MDIYALDKDFTLVTPNIPYYNLQWTRRYFEPGEFEVEIRLMDYSPDWKYIASESRPELGIIQSTQKKEETHTILLSGFFYEKILDDKACFPRFKDSGKTSKVCTDIFNRFKGTLPIVATQNQPILGDDTTCDFSDDNLAKKLYSVLETRELSFSVKYNHEENKREFFVWQGKDRTQGNADNNPFYVFSTVFGNIKNVSYKHDESKYKNYLIIPVAKDDSGVETDTFYIDNTNGHDKKELVMDKRSSKQGSDETYAQFKEGILQDGREKLLSNSIVESIDIDTANTNDYLIKYDLGDKCDVIVPELNLYKQLRIIEVREVFKDSGHTVDLEFGHNRKGGM